MGGSGGHVWPLAVVFSDLFPKSRLKERGQCNFTEGKPGEHHLDQETKVNSVSEKSCWRYRSQQEVEWLFTSMVFFPKTHQTRLSARKTSDKPILRNILQNTWPVRLKTVKVIKTKERLRKSHKPGETEDTRCIKATWDPEWELGNETGHLWKMSEF